MSKNKDKNKDKNVIINSSKKRLRITLIIVIVIFVGLAIRIGWIQFVDGASLKERAYKNQTLNQILSPKRGTIYDSTGKALAMSAPVDTVSVNPSRIKVKNDDDAKTKTIALKEKIAKEFSEIFSLDYTETLEKLNSDSAVEMIAKKVETDKITALKKWMEENDISEGINIDEDTKRYYPFNNLASSLIGFCGTDNQGLVGGIELKWDSTLAGTPGKIVSSKDAVQEEIPDAKQTYIPPQNGSDIILTIDANIQSIVEKYLKQAVESNQCKRGGNVLMMNPNTGDILAMATYPDYNLNTPFEPNSTLQTTWDSLSSQEKSDALNQMWRNKAVSDTYEPGSTFKVINASVALEENITGTDVSNDFVCVGYQLIEGEPIDCWRKYNPHGYETLRQALQNSCNPAFMQLGARIGAPTLYKYYEAYGLFERTNVSISGEAASDFWDLNDVGPFEVATMSFGQRFKITPLQMISAVSAVANDGILMKPRIVKQVINTDTNVTTDIESVEVRQVVSKETSEQIRSMMESVVTIGTGGNGAVKGYSVGGKTGTSEADPNKLEEGFVASYVGISPVANPEVVILVILYGPNGYSYQGGQIAGPVVNQILTEVLPYLGIPSDSSNESNGDNSIEYVTVKDVRNKTVTEARKILENSGFECKVSINGNANQILVTDQVPKPGISLPKGSTILLYSEDSSTRVSVQVPNLIGMTVNQAINSLKSKNLNISIEGSGRVASQTPSYQSSVEEGSVINVVLSDVEEAH